ncbi:MAG TPA: NAD(P)H-binding protein [Galbitalea sp.]|jgi:uncharacterized protein YbjT (DUF2867 family)|nr:NAD(P)H-binding protein [Galbitalea sp.]
MKIAVAGGTGAVGAHVVAALVAAGHEPVVLSRSTGIDLMTGLGLDGALSGAAAVVDASGQTRTLASASRRFFGTVTRNLLESERRAGVGHHVVVSIVGAAAVNAGYFAGKRLQEDLVTASGAGWTILRATQFYEFAPMLVRTASVGPFVVAPQMKCQPVSAAEVGAALAALAVGEPRGLVPDLGGPGREVMGDMVRQYLKRTGKSQRVLEITVPGRWWHALRDGSILPGANAQRGSQSYEDWLLEQ